MAAAMLNATLAGRLDISEDLCILKIKPDTGVPAFEPGQFVRLGLYEGTGEAAKLIKRAYSIASSPDDHESLEFYVVKVREGRLTPEVWELPIGGRLWIDAKIQGEFTLHAAPPTSDMLMVATGTGIAPYVSMLRTYAGKQHWRRVVLVHGVRRVVDLGYREELEGFARRHPEIRYIPIVSRDPDALWSGRRGRVMPVFEPAAYEELSGAQLEAGQTHVFLCGNPEMVQAARAVLEPQGFVMSQRRHPGTIHSERYW